MYFNGGAHTMSQQRSQSHHIPASVTSNNYLSPIPALPTPMPACVLKLAFHGADTDTDTDSPNTATVLRPINAISARGSSQACRRVGEDVRVGVGTVECELNAP